MKENALTITPKPVTITGLSASEKVYDGTTTATVTGTATIDGKVGNDDVSVSAGSASFDNASVGTGKTVTFSGYSLSGTMAGNYTLSAQPASVTANITKKAVTVTAKEQSVEVGGSIATGTAQAELSGALTDHTLSEITLTGDTSAVTNNGTITPKDAVIKDGSGNDVTGNYNISYTKGTLTVTKKQITVSGITASNKTYDGNTTATLDCTNAVLTGKADGDSVTVTATGTFDSKDVGTGKIVTISGLTLSGTDADKYDLAPSGQQTSTTASITAKPVTVSGVTATNRDYEAGKLTVALTGGTVNDVESGDTVTVDLSAATGTMADANAGTDKPVTVSGIALSGADAGNYTLSGPTGITVTISRAVNPATVTGTASVTKGNHTVDLSSYVALNGATGTVSYEISGAANGCSLDGSVLTSGADMGSVTINVTVAADDNYLESSGLTITVTVTDKATQTVSFADATMEKTYGDADFTITATGAETNVSYAITSGDAATVDGSTGKVHIVKAGTVTITATAEETTEYAGASTSYTLTINRKAVTVKAENKTMVYGASEPELTAAVTGIVGSDTVAYTLLREEGTAVGTYTITPIGNATQGNYTVTYETGTFTITNKPVYTVTVEHGTGDGSFEAGATVTITADAPETGKVFDKWTTSDGVTFANASSASTTFTMPAKAVTVTATYKTAKTDPVITKAPAARTGLVYNGQPQELVTAGEATGGTFYYALGDANGATQPYTTSIPTATNAGSYYVWYKIVGDQNHTDSEPAEITVVMENEKTAPVGEIIIDTHKWNAFLNTITFGFFFKETQKVTITASDDLSGVEKTEYYISENVLSLDQVKDVTGWKNYDSPFKLNPEKKYVIYAKITDKAGNITFISSDGVVFVSLPGGYVTDIATDSAKLNMKLSAFIRSEIKEAGFEYKKKADAETAWTKVAADSVTEMVAKEITSLTAGTDYMFRPYVTYKNDSTSTGAELNFTTDIKPAVLGRIDVKVKNDTTGNKDVVVMIEEGNTVLASQEYDGIGEGVEVTTGKFKELPDGTYNIVIKSKDGDFVETKMITIANGAAETISFTISKGEMKTDVEVGADTPKVAVDGLSKEELVQSGTVTPDENAKVESGEISLEVTMKAEKKEKDKIETDTVKAIEQVMAKSTIKHVVDMFLDLSLFKTVTQLTGDQAGKVDETDIGSTNQKVLEIAVPYDTTIKGLMVYRYHGSVASALKKLSSAPAKGASHEDGSFYLSDKYIHIFASGFSTYAIAKEESSSGGSGGGSYSPGKTTPVRPAAPALDSKTDASITVKTVAGQVYSIDGGKNWQASGTFTGLSPETEYSIVTKVSETSTSYESAVSDALKVKTDKKADVSTPTTGPGGTSTPTNKPDDTAAPDGPAAPTDQPSETAAPDSTTTPTDKPGDTAAPGSTETPDAGKKPAAEGTVLVDAGKTAYYAVTSADMKHPTVAYKQCRNKKAKKVTIPKTVKIGGVTYTVTSIAANAFKNHKTITKVAMGKNIRTIGKNAFYGCKKLKTVTIGKNVTKIGAGAFSGCKKLVTVKMGSRVSVIGDKAFYNCASLKSITLPKTVKKIGKNAFYGCGKLKKITVKTKKLTLKNVGKDAFSGIYIRASVLVPEDKRKEYALLFRKRGAGKKIRIKTK